MKTVLDIKAERMHQQQNCTTRNVKRSHSSRRKMTTDGNINLCNKMKCTLSGYEVGKYIRFLNLTVWCGIYNKCKNKMLIKQ